ncbi:hypothetical protein [Coleofasciculus sp. FACHB-501]|uniref:hypothetical protein n=1 Tax=Cyanophyceae TaxID=3028117 RepID=UPI0016889A4A|nr:hypothetical protein [Coleofasciculus sp. FACHB-501]MBD1838897.1 hypothetical protein [Coleofasciculus sp. FACHB-501]
MSNITLLFSIHSSIGGATDWQVRAAAHFLSDKNLIDLGFCILPTALGLSIANVLFISCNLKEIARITFSRGCSAIET